MQSTLDKPVSIRAIHDHVLVTDMDFGDQTTESGIILQSDNGTGRGIHPRWAKVYGIGPDQKDVAVGQWVLVEHGRWTRNHKITDKQTNDELELRRVEAAAIMLVSDNPPPSDILFGKE